MLRYTYFYNCKRRFTCYLVSKQSLHVQSAMELIRAHGSKRDWGPISNLLSDGDTLDEVIVQASKSFDPTSVSSNKVQEFHTNQIVMSHIFDYLIYSNSQHTLKVIEKSYSNENLATLIGVERLLQLSSISNPMQKADTDKLSKITSQIGSNYVPTVTAEKYEKVIAQTLSHWLFISPTFNDYSNLRSTIEGMMKLRKESIVNTTKTSDSALIESADLFLPRFILQLLTCMRKRMTERREELPPEYFSIPAYTIATTKNFRIKAPTDYATFGFDVYRNTFLHSVLILVDLDELCALEKLFTDLKDKSRAIKFPIAAYAVIAIELTKGFPKAMTTLTEQEALKLGALDALFHCLDGPDERSYEARNYFFHALLAIRNDVLFLRYFRFAVNRNAPSSREVFHEALRIYFETGTPAMKQAGVAALSSFREQSLKPIPEEFYQREWLEITTSGAIGSVSNKTMQPKMFGNDELDPPRRIIFDGPDCDTYNQIIEAGIALKKPALVDFAFTSLVKDGVSTNFKLLKNIMRASRELDIYDLCRRLLAMVHGSLVEQATHFGSQNWQPPVRGISSRVTSLGSRDLRETIYDERGSKESKETNARDIRLIIPRLEDYQISTLFHEAIVLAERQYKGGDALYLIKQLLSFGVQPAPYMTAKVMKALMYNKRPADVVKLYEELASIGAPRDRRHVTHLVEALPRCGRIRHAEAALFKMHDEGRPLFLEAYRSVIHFNLKSLQQAAVDSPADMSAADSHSLEIVARIAAYLLLEKPGPGNHRLLMTLDYFAARQRVLGMALASKLELMRKESLAEVVDMLRKAATTGLSQVARKPIVIARKTYP